MISPTTASGRPRGSEGPSKQSKFFSLLQTQEASHSPSFATNVLGKQAQQSRDVSPALHVSGSSYKQPRPATFNHAPASHLSSKQSLRQKHPGARELSQSVVKTQKKYPQYHVSIERQRQRATMSSLVKSNCTSLKDQRMSQFKLTQQVRGSFFGRPAKLKQFIDPSHLVNSNERPLSSKSKKSSGTPASRTKQPGPRSRSKRYGLNTQFYRSQNMNFQEFLTKEQTKAMNQTNVLHQVSRQLQQLDFSSTNSHLDDSRLQAQGSFKLQPARDLNRTHNAASLAQSVTLLNTRGPVKLLRSPDCQEVCSSFNNENTEAQTMMGNQRAKESSQLLSNKSNLSPMTRSKLNLNLNTTSLDRLQFSSTQMEAFIRNNKIGASPSRMLAKSDVKLGLSHDNEMEDEVKIMEHHQSLDTDKMQQFFKKRSNAYEQALNRYSSDQKPLMLDHMSSLNSFTNQELHLSLSQVKSLEARQPVDLKDYRQFRKRNQLQQEQQILEQIKSLKRDALQEQEARKSIEKKIAQKFVAQFNKVTGGKRSVLRSKDVYDSTLKEIRRRYQTTKQQVNSVQKQRKSKEKAPTGLSSTKLKKPEAGGGASFDPKQNYSTFLCSNKMKIIEESWKKEKACENRHLDPIRMKIRVLPIHRVPNMTNQFIYIKAGMQCIQNKLESAMKLLNIGLQLCNNTFLYTFTHGTIMFKLGFLEKALHDFRQARITHHKDPIVHFNLALTLFQMGRYAEANETLNSVIQLYHESISVINKNVFQDQNLKPDKALMLDTHMVKAQCLWRTAQPLEAVKSFHKAQRFVDGAKDKKRRIFMNHELRRLIKDLNYREFKADVKMATEAYLAGLSKTPRHRKPPSMTEVAPKSNFLRQKTMINARVSFVEDEAGIPVRVVQRQLTKKTTSKVRSFKGSNSSRNSERESDVETPEETKNEGGRRSKASSRSKLLAKEEKQKLKAQLAEMRQVTEINKKVSQQVEAEEFYHKLRQDQLKIIDEGHGKRFDMLYSDLLQDNRQADQQALKALLSNQFIKKEVFAKIVKLMQKRPEEKLTQEENTELELRRRIGAEHQAVLEQQEAAAEQELQEAKFIDTLIENEAEGHAIKNRKIRGTPFCQQGLDQINKMQGELEGGMQRLLHKFTQLSSQWDREIDKDDKKIFQSSLKDHYIQQKLEMLELGADVDSKNFNHESVTSKLRMELKRETQYPDAVINILQTDLEEKEKKRKIKHQSQRQINFNQMTQKKLELIRKEFKDAHGGERQIKVLEAMLGGLKFLKRFSEDQRLLVFRKADLLTLPPRSTIFEQGDRADKMYIIIKGRVVVEKKSQKYGNLPINVAMLQGGDHFGELGLINQDRIEQKNTKKNGPDIDLSDLGKSEQQQFQPRTASCITTEETDLIVLDHKVSSQLIQPSDEAEETKEKNESEAAESNRKTNNELNINIQFLMNVPLFSVMHPKNLVAIACNLKPRTFTFGQYLVREGEVPEGLFIIVQGHCKVVANRHLRAGCDADELNVGKVNWTNSKTSSSKTAVLKEVASNRKLMATMKEMEKLNNSEKSAINTEVSDNQVVFSQLTRGDSFGARVLVPFEHYQSMQQLFSGGQERERFVPGGCSQAQRDAIMSETNEHYKMKSLLSVQADSAKVDVWVIDKNDMGYIDDKSLKQGFEAVIKQKEIDRPHTERDIHFIVEQFRVWTSFKEKFIHDLQEVKRVQQKKYLKE